ncbi:FAD-dependent oxidoreductase [Rhodococcoides yunnanense]|uniref:FAD-dependent oxidoreductase n=1 Tax=Rhodococcoides yunnanense TaxID=278209 RepID=UPI00093227DA|nr:FAD-dependent oxidoreductase [Rhodococcus yunnanensis]
MTFVILQQCCNDASCTDVCPVDCIHPTPDEPGFMTADMLHIDPDVCIDCGACVDECPVDAIRADHELEVGQARYLDLNADYFDSHPTSGTYEDPSPTWKGVDFSGKRVAIVGTGPAAFYTAMELASIRGIEVEMFERLLSPYGLVRAGVAPDHPGTKTVSDLFRTAAGKKSVRVHFGVDIGRDISHEELIARHDAVVYATGASGDRRLGIDGEELAGSVSASEFVAWYNAHPDHAHRRFDLSGERAVIIGNGNVALDVARILLAPIEVLERTDIADHALEELRHSTIREVVIVGRRSSAQAAYTNPELLELMDCPWIDIELAAADAEPDDSTRAAIEAGTADSSTALKVQLAREIATKSSTVDFEGSQKKRLVFRFCMSPVEILDDEGNPDRQSATAIRLARNTLTVDEKGTVEAARTDEIETLRTGLVLRSVGYRGQPIASVPFDERRGTIPNLGGRVTDTTGAELPGVYVAGWVKRGPSGVIGTNKKCAAETVRSILSDIAGGRLTPPAMGRAELDALLQEKSPESLDFSDWSRIDKAEITEGQKQGRPRVKFIGMDEMRNALQTEQSDRY